MMLSILLSFNFSTMIGWHLNFIIWQCLSSRIEQLKPITLDNFKFKIISKILEPARVPMCFISQGFVEPARPEDVQCASPHKSAPPLLWTIGSWYNRLLHLTSDTTSIVTTTRLYKHDPLLTKGTIHFILTHFPRNLDTWSYLPPLFKFLDLCF